MRKIVTAMYFLLLLGTTPVTAQDGLQERLSKAVDTALSGTQPDRIDVRGVGPADGQLADHLDQRRGQGTGQCARAPATGCRITGREPGGELANRELGQGRSRRAGPHRQPIVGAGSWWPDGPAGEGARCPPGGA